jgi:menaquinone-dependent protoporphyrinogen oxidase
MTILVAAASKYGATEEIGEAIAEELRARGFQVEYLPAKDVGDVSAYDAAIIGSAVYMGKWLGDATKVIERESTRLKSIPVWIFSSGPIGSPEPKPKGGAVEPARYLEATGAHEHRVFAGKVDKRRLSFADRTIVRVVGAQEGDFRDWEAIRAWAREIAEILLSGVRGQTRLNDA